MVWNHLWEHRFSALSPRAFRPPWDRFSARITENRNYNWACHERGSPVIKKSFFGETWSKLDQQRVISIIAENKPQDHHNPHLHTMKVYIASSSSFLDRPAPEKLYNFCINLPSMSFVTPRYLSPSLGACVLQSSSITEQKTYKNKTTKSPKKSKRCAVSRQ